MKISHFNEPGKTPVEDEESWVSSSPIQDQSELGSLYPHAKTFDEQAKEDQERELRLEHRQAKCGHFKVAFSGAVVLGAGIIFAQGIGAYWLGLTDRNAFSMVFISFLGALVLAAAAIAWIRFANTILYASMAAGWPFWVVTIGIALAELFGSLATKIYAGPGASFYMPIVLLFVTLYVAQKVITLKRR